MAAIVELLLALLVELFREFQQWWMGRARLRGAPAERPETAQFESAARSSGVERQVAELLARHARRHVGVAVGVLRGEQTWVMGSGTQRRGKPAPPAANTIFEIGSVTKVFTATLLATLVEEGVLALGDPAQEHLPPGVELPVRGRPITLADLATHTAGLPRMPHGFFLRSVRHRHNPYGWLTVDHLYAGLPSTRLRREPGGRPRYSNLGYGLLGHALATCAGRGYEQLVRERISRPLALADTEVSVPAAVSTACSASSCEAYGPQMAATAPRPSRLRRSESRRRRRRYSLVGLRSIPSPNRRSTVFSGVSGGSSWPSLKRPWCSVPGGTSSEIPRAKFGSSCSSGVSRSWS